MKLMHAIHVDDARVKALTPEAFRLVLEVRGWVLDRAHHIYCLTDEMTLRGDCIRPAALVVARHSCLALMADTHHDGSTYMAFLEVERVQEMLDALAARGLLEQAAAAARIICGLEPGE